MMRLILLLLLMCAPAFAGSGGMYPVPMVYQGGSSPVTYLMYETAEATGSCENWTTTSTLPDFNATANAISGTQSAFFDNTTDHRMIHTLATGQSEIYVAFEYRAAPTVGVYEYLLRFNDGSGGTITQIRYEDSSSAWRISHDATYTIPSAIDVALGGSTGYIKIYYKASDPGMSNGVIKAWFDTGGTDWGSPVEITGVADEQGVADIRFFGATINLSWDVWVDEIRASVSDITTVNEEHTVCP